MCTYFNTKTDVAQNLIRKFFFLALTVRGPFHWEDFKIKKIWGYNVNFLKKTEALYAELNEIAKVATSSYSVTGDFLHICSVPVSKRNQSI